MAGLVVQAGEIRWLFLRPVNIDLAQALDGNALATIAVSANPTLNLGVSLVLAGPDPFLDRTGRSP